MSLPSTSSGTFHSIASGYIPSSREPSPGDNQPMSHSRSRSQPPSNLSGRSRSRSPPPRSRSPSIPPRRSRSRSPPPRNLPRRSLRNRPRRSRSRSPSPRRLLRNRPRSRSPSIPPRNRSRSNSPIRRRSGRPRNRSRSRSPIQRRPGRRGRNYLRRVSRNVLKYDYDPHSLTFKMNGGNFQETKLPNKACRYMLSHCSKRHPLRRDAVPRHTVITIRKRRNI